MATKYSSKYYMLKHLILLPCIAISFRIGYATRPSPSPRGPEECIQSIANIGVCFANFWINFGKLSEPCCKTLTEIDDACLPKLLPQNPFILSFFKGLCSNGGSGGVNSVYQLSPSLPLPIPLPPGIPLPPTLPLPIPFPPSGGGGGGGGGIIPFPPLFPSPGTGGGFSAPAPPKEE